MVYEAVAYDQHDDGQEEDAHRDPGDVGADAPRLDEVAPAVVDVGAVADFAEREDKVLWGAEREAAQPRAADHDVGAARGLLHGLQRVAYSDVAVHRHHHHHVSGRKHTQHLEVLHDPAQEVWPVEAEGDLPAQLRQHLKKSHHQVCQAQVLDKKVHARRLLLRLAHRCQDAEVAHDGHGKDQAQHRDLKFGHLLVPTKRVAFIG